MRKNTIVKFTSGLVAIVASLIGAIAIAAESPTLVCGLTGQESKICCCEQKEGKLLCKHTGKVLEKCCCTTK